MTRPQRRHCQIPQVHDSKLRRLRSLVHQHHRRNRRYAFLSTPSVRQRQPESAILPSRTAHSRIRASGFAPLRQGRRCRQRSYRLKQIHSAKFQETLWLSGYRQEILLSFGFGGHRLAYDNKADLVKEYLDAPFVIHNSDGQNANDGTPCTCLPSLDRNPRHD